MLTIRDLERMQAEAQKLADELFARWQEGFMGGRNKREPRMMAEMPMDETDGTELQASD